MAPFKLPSLLAPLLSMLLAAAPLPATANTCETCHSQNKFFSQNKRIFDYYQDWLTSPHRDAGITCEQCHDGNPEKSDKHEAHAGVQGVSDPSSRVFYRNQPETCGKCHAPVVEQFTHSAHYKALHNEVAAPNCSTCHRAMNRKPYFHDIVEKACRSCHANTITADQERPVVDLAHEILHRLNIAKGYLGWTTVYYESKGWPDDTKQKLASLREEYHDILATGHSFDLQKSDRASVELLAELKIIFRKAWGERQAK